MNWLTKISQLEQLPDVGYIDVDDVVMRVARNQMDISAAQQQLQNNPQACAALNRVYPTVSSNQALSQLAHAIGCHLMNTGNNPSQNPGQKPLVDPMAIQPEQNQEHAETNAPAGPIT